MFKYQNVDCPYCGKPLKETDDLAVCPECGTPHHRACYKEHGCCANESRHAEGFNWVPPVPSTPDDRATAGKACARCGALNASSARFCDRCGAPFSPAPSEMPPAPGGAGYGPAGWQTPLAQNPLLDQRFDGIAARDWMVYIASSVGYYLYNFQMQDRTGRKISFTWSAMLFPFLYFLYRKVWGAAAVAFAVDLLLKFPIAFATFFVPQGITLGLTPATWNLLSNVCYYLSLVINCLWGLFAVYLYRRTSARRIKTLQHASVNEQDFHARLARVGGPSYVAIICICMVYLALNAAVLFLSSLSSALL